MFAILKSKYIRCLIGIFVFIFVSFVTYSSYASVCFLPTGDCGGDDVSADTHDDLPFWCEEDDPDPRCKNNSNDSIGCTGSNCNNSGDTETECTTSCTKEEGHRTCTTDSNGCSIVAKECSGNTYLTQAYCTSANSGKTCTQSGSCWVVDETDDDPIDYCIEASGYYDTQAACTSANSGKTCTQSGSCWVVDETDDDPIDYCIETSGYYDTQAACTSANSGKTCIQSGNCWVVNTTPDEDDGTDDTDECPSDKICFKFNYTCNGESCSKTFFENYPFNVGTMFLYGEDFEEYFYEDKENEQILEITTLNIDKSLIDNGYYNYLYIYSYADDDNYDADISYDTITKTRDFAMELQLNNNKVDISFCDSMLSDCEHYKELSASDNIIDINIDMRDCVHAKPNYINIAATCYHMNKFDCNSSDIIKSYEARMACQELKEKGCINIWSKTQKKKIEVSDITPIGGDGTYIYRLPYKQCSMGDKLAITPVNQIAEDGSSILFDQEFIFDGTYGKDITVKGTDISKSDDGKNLELYPVIKVYKKLNYTNSYNYLTAAAIIAVHDPFNLVSNDDAFVTRKDPNVGFRITYQGYSQSSVSFNESFKQMSGYDAVNYNSKIPIWQHYIPLISTAYIAEKTYSLTKSILSVEVTTGQIDKEFVDYYVNEAGGTRLINWSNTYKLW